MRVWQILAVVALMTALGSAAPATTAPASNANGREPLRRGIGHDSPNEEQERGDDAPEPVDEPVHENAQDDAKGPRHHHRPDRDDTDLRDGPGDDARVDYAPDPDATTAAGDEDASERSRSGRGGPRGRHGRQGASKGGPKRGSRDNSEPRDQSSDMSGSVTMGGARERPWTGHHRGHGRGNHDGAGDDTDRTNEDAAVEHSPDGSSDSAPQGGQMSRRAAAVAGVSCAAALVAVVTVLAVRRRSRASRLSADALEKGDEAEMELEKSI